MGKIEILRKCDIFRAFNEEQIKVIEKMCTPQVFESGTTICKQGVIGGNLYVIEEGLVGIILEVGPLSQRQVQAASNFEVFGWSSVIEPFTCTATAKAIENTKVLSFNGQELYDLSLSRPDIGSRMSRGVARVLGDRLRHAYTQLLGVTAQD